MSKTKPLALILGVIILSFLVGYLVFAQVWQEPTAPPPGENVPAPLNVSSTTQAKSGRLDFTEFRDYNNVNYYVNPSGATSAILAGNVGIGTTGPANKLHLKDGSMEIENGDLRFHPDTSGFGAEFDYYAGKLYIGRNTDHSTQWHMVIQDDGDVGIGTTSPGYKLDVDGSANAQQLCIAGDCKNAWPSAGADSDWVISGSNMYSGVSGNVGIGTTSPGYKLDVNGDIRSTGYVRGDTGLCIAGNCKTSWPSGGIICADCDPRFVNEGQGDSITSAMIVNGTITASDVNTTQIQRRAGGTCYGNVMVAINENGTVVCEPDDTAGAGLGCADCDPRFVNATGDTMTGALTINTSSNDKISLRGTQASPHTIWLGDSKGVRFWDSVNGELMRVTNTGRVGIGTTGPSSKLHVSGGTGSVDLLVEADTDNAGEGDQSSITLSQDGGAVTGKLGYFNSTNQLTLKNVYNDALHLGTNNTNRLTILGSGRVGIGTTSPTEKLDVDGYVKGRTGLCITDDCRTSWPTSNIESFNNSGSVPLSIVATEIARVEITTTGRPVLLLYTFLANNNGGSDEGVMGWLYRNGAMLPHVSTNRIHSGSDSTLTSYYFDPVGAGTHTYILYGVSVGSVEASNRQLIAIEL